MRFTGTLGVSTSETLALEVHATLALGGTDVDVTVVRECDPIGQLNAFGCDTVRGWVIGLCSVSWQPARHHQDDERHDRANCHGHQPRPDEASFRGLCYFTHEIPL